MPTKIEWTDETWNPIVGCSKISTGCKECYAEKMAYRLSAIALSREKPSALDYYVDVITDGKWNGKTFLNNQALTIPLKWKNPRKIFVCSMGDLFHESVPFEWIDAVFSVMSDNDQHIYQVLTKRPHRILAFFTWKWNQVKHLHPIIDPLPWVPKPNIWFGVTIENQDQANIRLRYLNVLPVQIKFVSCEPLLSEINFETALGKSIKWRTGGLINCISWVICGGETGKKARPMHPDWAISLKDQCKDSGAPFFFKGWGEYKYLPGTKNAMENDEIVLTPDGNEKLMTADPNAVIMKKVGKKHSGRLINKEEFTEFPNPINYEQ